MKRIGKWLAVILVSAMAFCMSFPAAAEETAPAGGAEAAEKEEAEKEPEIFTAENGVLSIELPSESWKEIQDEDHWIVLSDGACLLTVDHYSNGEKLPEVAVANDHYVNVYQAVFSTQNEVFIITGYAVDAEDIPEICKMIMSAKVLKYDTKMAAKKEKTSINEFAVVPVNKIMYTTADLNVRNGCSTSEQIIGSLAKGSEINVLGKVTRNGQDYGWYQIAYGSGIGYVSVNFVSGNPPAAAPEQPAYTLTGAARTIYDIDGNGVTVYEATDGYWYDSTGNQYDWILDYEFRGPGRNIYTVNQPILDEETAVPAGPTFTAFWLNGNATGLTPYSDGYFYSDDWVRYWYNGDGTYSGTDGTMLYTEEPVLSSEIVFMIYSRGSGRPVAVTMSMAGIYDDDGNQYYELGGGAYVDDYGNYYDEEYSPDPGDAVYDDEYDPEYDGAWYDDGSVPDDGEYAPEAEEYVPEMEEEATDG